MARADDALARLVREEGTGVLATLIRVTGQVELAQDAAQDAMVHCPFASLLEGRCTPARFAGKLGELVPCEHAIGGECVGEPVGCLSQQRLLSALV